MVKKKKNKNGFKKLKLAIGKRIQRVQLQRELGHIAKRKRQSEIKTAVTQARFEEKKKLAIERAVARERRPYKVRVARAGVRAAGAALTVLERGVATERALEKQQFVRAVRKKRLKRIKKFRPKFKKPSRRAVVADDLIRKTSSTTDDILRESGF